MWSTICTFEVAIHRISTKYSIQHDMRGSWRIVYMDLTQTMQILVEGRAACQPYATLCALTLA